MNGGEDQILLLSFDEELEESSQTNFLETKGVHNEITKTSAQAHKRLNRPIDEEKESGEVLGVLLEQEARLSRPLYTRCSVDCRGEYVNERRLVKVPQSIRSRFPFLGFTENNVHYIYPEEAVYLAETSRLVISFDSVLITNFQRIYALLLARSGTLNPSPYGLYSRISKNGTRLRRLRRYLPPSETKVEQNGGGIGAGEYLALLTKESKDYASKCDTVNCGVFYRWDEKAIFRHLFRSLRKVQRDSRFVEEDVNDGVSVEARRVPARPFPSLSFPLFDICQVSPNISKSTLSALRSDWDERFRRLPKKPTWTEVRRTYAAAADKLEDNRHVVDSRAEKELKRFGSLLQRMKAVLKYPDRLALAELHSPRIQIGDSDDFSIQSNDFERFEKDWTEAKQSLTAKGCMRRGRDYFKHVTKVPDVMSFAGHPNASQGVCESKFRKWKDKRRMAYEVDPPPKSKASGNEASWSTLVLPQTSSKNDELGLGDVLMWAGVRMLGLDMDTVSHDAGASFSPTSAILIGSCMGEEFDVLSLTTCPIPSPDEVEN